MKCLGPRAKDVHLWIVIWEELHRAHQEGILVDIEHVKAHRTKKENSANVFLRKVRHRRQAS